MTYLSESEANEMEDRLRQFCQGSPTPKQVRISKRKRMNAIVKFITRMIYCKDKVKEELREEREKKKREHVEIIGSISRIK